MTNAMSGIDASRSLPRVLRTLPWLASGSRHSRKGIAGPRLVVISVTACILGLPIASAGEIATNLAILPPRPRLTGPHATQQLIVEAMRGGQLAGDVTVSAKFTSSHPQIAQVSAAGVVTPVGDGIATIQAEVAGDIVETQVEIKSATAAEPW